ncbi:ABC transporter ATP-binding protein [uncultured Amaricoccus sp.]|uniref:ABC transporter ATP-binding protein n=1 Tax=uncultured Amaricoccus sp. TaxID=339341 RepID=UPI00260A8AF5|nr:ABC transporter ATP-binding protein [uncultured Amaricoccus sp.]
MIETYRKLLDLLTPRERRRFYLLLAMIVVMGLLQMLTVASILPLMFVLQHPAIIETNAYLSWVYSTFGFTSHQSFTLALASGVFIFVIFGMVFKMVTTYATYRFSMRRSYTISSRMLSGYLLQPYTWFLDRHSAALGAAVLGEVQKVVATALLPAMKFLTGLVTSVALVALLLVARPGVALVTAGMIGGVYVLLYVGVRRRINHMGRERHQLNEQRFRIVGEAFGGMKDVKLLGLEGYFVDRFRGPARRIAEYDAISMSLVEVPRHVIEGVAFGGLVGFILYLLITGEGSFSSVIPILSLFAFAAIRLFPSLQQVYGSLGQMRFATGTLDKLHKDFVAMAAATPIRPASGKSAPALRLTERLEIEDVHYAYPHAERTAVQGLSLVIPARSTVGIVGGTGAGKTTTVDIMLGLLVPDRGTLSVDGIPITAENLRAWQRSIGYVPQQIFLADDTVAANIAFGRAAEDIDQAAVERAARIAELHDFVMRELPDGYATKVGERGVRLSGGQRQRIGIARALYHDPDVLILDEATSALDNLTERAVMDAVHNLGRAKTVVMIAHRLSTVRECDTIFMLEGGRVVAEGSYDALIESNRQFRALAGA